MNKIGTLPCMKYISVGKGEQARRESTEPREGHAELGCVSGNGYIAACERCSFRSWGEEGIPSSQGAHGKLHEVGGI